MAIVEREAPAEPRDSATQDSTAAQKPRWELAECTCPDPCCERDHEQD